MTRFGSFERKVLNDSKETVVPVGLFGLQIKTLAIMSIKLSAPLEITILSSGIANFLAIAFLKIVQGPSGYRWIWGSSSRMAATALGEGPRRFSLEASFTHLLAPHSF